MCRLVMYLLITTMIFVVSGQSTGGLPCSSQYSMKPNGVAKAQNIAENPPPFKFSVLNSKGEQIKYYRNEIYTVKLTTATDETFFQEFLLQARLSTRQGFVIGHLRSGEFLFESNWHDQGIDVHKCQPIFNDSLTNVDKKKKSEITAKWKPHGNDGPIQFVLTIVQDQDLFWQQWSPESGLILPDKSFKFVEQLTIPKQHVEKDGEKSEAKFIANNGTRLNRVENEKKIIVESESSGESENESEYETLSPRPIENAESAITEFTDEPKPIENAEKINTHRPSSAKEDKISKTKNTEISHSVLTTEKIIDDEEVTENDNSKHANSDILSPFIAAGNTVRKGQNRNSETKNSKSAATEPPGNNIDYCSSSPCYNNGTCKNVPESDRYECSCPITWGGLDCGERNYCIENLCKNGAECVSSETNFTCECKPGWTGVYCDKNCPVDVCQHGGTCNIDSDNRYKCICKPGFVGDRCETDFDECASNPCLNNGTCVDKEDFFQCQCVDGFMGDRCHRPCQDIYQSCEFWQEQDRCETMRPSTRFFDVNCAVTCDQCAYKNSTVFTNTPLPPILEPFEFLLGKWVINFSDPMRYPANFAQASHGYYEEIEFIVPPVIMFGTPSLNFSAKAVNNDDPTDIQINVGFLNLSPNFRPHKVSIMSTGNDGITLLEEGDLISGSSMKLQAEYMVFNPLLNKTAPKMLKREFVLQGKYLQESAQRTSSDEQTDYFTKYYTKPDSVF